MEGAVLSRSADGEHISEISSIELNISTALCSMQSGRGRSHGVREDEELLHEHVRCRAVRGRGGNEACDWDCFLLVDSILEIFFSSDGE